MDINKAVEISEKYFNLFLMYCACYNNLPLALKKQKQHKLVFWSDSKIRECWYLLLNNITTTTTAYMSIQYINT